MLLQDPYEISVAYVDGRPIGRVESEPMVLNQPDPDRLRPYIEAFLREGGAPTRRGVVRRPAALTDPYRPIQFQ